MKKHYHHIDGLRFLLSVLIVYFHIFHESIMPFAENDIFYTLGDQCAKAKLLVECFLIMGGYFLYLSFQRNPGRPVLEFILDRLFRLWPVLALSTLLNVYFFRETAYDGLFSIFLLRATGISLNYVSMIWYIGPFFWCSVFLFIVLRSFSRSHGALLIAVMTYLCYAVNLNYLDGDLGREVIYGFLSLAMCRAMAGVGLGILLAMVQEQAHKVIGRPQTEKRSNIILFTLLETGILGYLSAYLFFGFAPSRNAMVVVIGFCVLFLALTRGNGLLSWLTNRPAVGFWGQYSYSIYVMQQVVLSTLKRTLWKNTEFVNNHPLRCIALSVLICVLVGVAASYCVEKPAMKLYRRWKKQWNTGS